MSHFDGKTWLRHDPDEGHGDGVHVHVFDGALASWSTEPTETYVQTPEGWVDGAGEPVDVVLADDLDVLIAPVDLASE